MKRAGARTAVKAKATPARAAGRSGWQGERLSAIRRLIRQADPDVVEEQKWKKPTNPTGVPVWYHDGILCTGESYKNHVRFTFARGSELEDPEGLFNANLQGKTRAIVLRESDELDEAAFRSLIRAAVALNSSGAHPSRTPG